MRVRYISELEAQTQKSIDKIIEMYKTDPVKAEKELKSILKEEHEDYQSTIRDLIENGPEEIKEKLAANHSLAECSKQPTPINDPESDPDND